MARRQLAFEVVFTSAARAEWIAIWQWNATQFGERRADSYVGFLEAEIEKLARNPNLGAEVTDFVGLRRRLAKKRSSGYGHIIFYRVLEARIEVIHIYHTAQDWQSKLDGS